MFVSKNADNEKLDSDGIVVDTNLVVTPPDVAVIKPELTVKDNLLIGVVLQCILILASVSEAL